MRPVHILLLTAVVFWGWSFVATKVALKVLTPVELIGLRMLLGLPLLLSIILVKRINCRFEGRQYLILIAASLTLVLHFVIQVTGLVETSATNTGWLISVTPAALALLSWMFLRERLSLLQLLGLTVATSGIILLVSGGDFSTLDWLSNRGDWLVLGSAFTWAIYTIQIRNISRAKSPLAVTFAVLLGTSLFIWGYMLFTSDWGKFLHLPAEPLLAVIFLGIFCQALAFWFWQIAVSKLGAARAGFFLYLEPLATTSLAVPYLGEEFGLITVIGGLTVLGGVYLTEK